MSVRRSSTGSGVIEDHQGNRVEIEYTLHIAASHLPGWMPGILDRYAPESIDILHQAQTPTYLTLENGKKVEVSFSGFHPGHSIDVLWRRAD